MVPYLDQYRFVGWRFRRDANCVHGCVHFSDPISSGHFLSGCGSPHTVPCTVFGNKSSSVWEQSAVFLLQHKPCALQFLLSVTVSFNYQSVDFSCVSQSAVAAQKPGEAAMPERSASAKPRRRGGGMRRVMRKLECQCKVQHNKPYSKVSVHLRDLQKNLILL